MEKHEVASEPQPKTIMPQVSTWTEKTDGKQISI